MKKSRKKKIKTSDFLGKNIRTFMPKHRNFASEKSVLSAFPAEKRRKSWQNSAKNAFVPILRYLRTREGSVASVRILDPITAPHEARKTHRNNSPKFIAHSIRKTLFLPVFNTIRNLFLHPANHGGLKYHPKTVSSTSRLFNWGKPGRCKR